jgi:amino acid adenylation domain-containing protein
MQPTISSLAPPVASGPAMTSAKLPEPMRDWAGVSSEYPRTATVASVFEQIARDNPNAVALVSGELQLTYQELNERANRLAHRLRSAGVDTETMVACCLGRSVEMIVAFLAVLKAGGAYVPVDPSYPKARIELILGDAGNPPVLAARSSAPSLLANYSNRVIFVDDDPQDSPGAAHNLSRTSGPESLAYVMYTSGSTGRPKGVMVEQRGILRLVRGANYCHFGLEETFLQFAPPSFDASTFEIWGALLNGSRLVLMPQESSSLVDLVRAIRTHGVTTLWLTAGLFHLMVEEHLADFKSLRQLLAGGDVLSPRHVRHFLERAPATTLINGYGPTENTTFTCCHVVRSVESDSIPIGKPISNTRVYILDENGNPVSPGEIGELYAAGDGVARGYLNDPEMTSAKFSVDPFARGAQQRMYRTGDLARWRPDGTIDFLGRLDNQVKILGYRIEPGEIELALESGVKQACVVARAETAGSKRLAVYFVAAASGLTADELREFAASSLPQHMVPAFFVALESLPLSANGKIDRAALAQMQPAAKQQTSPNAALSGLERTLTELWQRVLKVQNVGLDDNFFDLGGDSLLLVAVHSNLQKQLQTEIQLTDLFEFSTIRKLAQHLGRASSTAIAASDSKQRAQRQREAFTRFRGHRSGGDS